MYAALLSKKLVLAVNEAQLVRQQFKQLNQDNYYCPSCKKRVILIVSQYKIPFFKHISFIKGAGETQEHLLSKKLLYSALVAYGYRARMEVSLAENQLRADILVSKNLAFEIQCAPLSEEEFKHRHSLYADLQIKDIWIVGRRHYLGKKLFKSQQKYLRKSKIWGWYLLEVDSKTMTLHLKYFIELAPNNNKCRYKIENFKLDEQGLNKLFKFDPGKNKVINSNYQNELMYLKKQLNKKTKFGGQIGEDLYFLGLTLENIPKEILIKWREPVEKKRIVEFLEQKKAIS